MSSLLWCVLWVQLGLSGTVFVWRLKFTPMCCTYFDTVFENLFGYAITDVIFNKTTNTWYRQKFSAFSRGSLLDRIISSWLWPTCSPMENNFEEKHQHYSYSQCQSKMCSSNPRPEDMWRKPFHFYTPNFDEQHNVSVRYDACPRAEGNHFQRLPKYDEWKTSTNWRTLYWNELTRTHGHWNSDEDCAACRHTKGSEWKKCDPSYEIISLCLDIKRQKY
jgi:hypothetical protein